MVFLSFPPEHHCASVFVSSSMHTVSSLTANFKIGLSCVVGHSHIDCSRSAGSGGHRRESGELHQRLTKWWA